MRPCIPWWTALLINSPMGNKIAAGQFYFGKIHSFIRYVIFYISAKAVASVSQDRKELSIEMKAKRFTRSFTLLILGQSSSLLGNFTLKFALSMYVLEKTGSAAVFAGLLAALPCCPPYCFPPLAAFWPDRANRRNIMVALDVLSGLAVLTAGIALNFWHDITVISILLVVLSVLSAFESPTVQACVPQMLSGDNLVKGNAAVSQMAAVTSLITPFLGSLFYTAFGIQPIFCAVVACFLITALLESFIQIDKPKALPKTHAPTIIKEDFTVTTHFLRREQPGILKLLLLAALVSLFVAGTAVVGFPYLVRTVLGLSAGYYGAAESAMGAAAIAEVCALRCSPKDCACAV